MCGRYTLTTPHDVVAAILGIADPGALRARWNIAPSQPVAIVRAAEGDARAARELVMVRWGLVPSWSKGPDDVKSLSLINARSETAATKPAFRAPMRRRRCLVPADSFYEWKKTGDSKQPMRIHYEDGRLFAFAGLWDRWEDPEHPGAFVDSCTILTTPPNDLLRPIHDRMPAILDPADYALWLDPSVDDPARITPLLHAAPAKDLVVTPVGRRVNNPKVDDARCAEPAAPDERARLARRPRPHKGDQPTLFG